jgi:Poxvirus A32 protein
MDSRSVKQKNQKTGLPPMKLYLMDMDETTKHESSRNVGHPASPSWPFSMLITGKSGSGKTNILANLFLGDKAEYIYKGKKGGSRYIACDDLIVCGYHPDEPKWAFVKYMYGIISKDPKAPYYENIRFSYISPEKIPSVRAFSPERSTAIVFEDVCLAPEYIQNQIGQFFGNGRHRNISCVYVAQKYHKINTFMRENASHLVIFNSGSYEDVSKIIRRYTDDVKNASMVINSYLRKKEFIVFDLTRSEDDPLAIRLRFDTPLNLQKEIEARKKRVSLKEG